MKEHAPQAQLLFDRFHIVKHLNEAVDAVRRQLWRRVTAKEKVAVKGTRWLLLKNPWNLNDEQKERLSTLARWNTPFAAKDMLYRCMVVSFGPTAPSSLIRLRA